MKLTNAPKGRNINSSGLGKELGSPYRQISGRLAKHGTRLWE